jgi:beta-glucosidase
MMAFTRRRAPIALLVMGICGLAVGSVAAAPMATAAPRPAAPRPAAQSRTPVQQAEALVAKMTLDQKISQLHGIENSEHERYVPGIASLGIPPLVITNGPAGVGPGDDPTQQPATALPAPISLAASFDPSLAYQYGKLIGKEAADLGNNLVEGPDVNIVRVYQGGRTFESLSEDPYLTSSVGTSEIEGIQSQPGMIAEVKHFDAYEQETYRNTTQDNNIVSDRVLHEIYDPPFEQAVTKAHSQTVMCSYAEVNGEFSCENPYLLTTTLDQRWGFDGFVQTDFGAAHSTVASAEAGLDLEMPTGDYYASPLDQAVEDGQVPVATVNQMLVARYAAMIRAGLFSHPISTSTIPAQQDGAFSESAAEQGMVLLKNSDSALPLDAAATSSVAVIGPYGGAAMTGGGGSSHVNPLLTVSPVQGIQSAVGSGVSVSYNDGSDISSAVTAAKAASVAIVMVGDTESEGADQSSLELSGNQDQLVEAVAAANPDTIVVVKSGNPVLMPWLNQVPAVLEAWYPGEEDGNAVAAILFGKVDPSGKLPVSFPETESQTPTSSPSQFPGVNGQIDYSEGLDVGYRWYDANNVTPMFPFGYGLSYTSFAFSDLRITPGTVRNSASGPGAASCDCNGQGSKQVTVSATITNTGKVAGADVAQLYLGDPAVAGEPPRQLESFDKVNLRPGQSTTVHFTLSGHDLSYWDDTANGWVLPDGTFHVYVGDSSALANLPLQGTFTVNRSVGARYASLAAASATVNPGSTTTVSATFTNDGDYAIAGAAPTLKVPAGWTVGAPSQRWVTLAAGQAVTVHWTVGVPVAAQGKSPTLTADLAAGPAGAPAIGNTTATATVTVKPAFTITTSSVLATAGTTGTATLTVASNLSSPATLDYTTTAPAGITASPAQGTVTVPPSGTTSAVRIQVASGLSPGSYPVELAMSVTDHGRDYQLPTATQIPVTVPYASVAAALTNVGISDDTNTSVASFDGDGASYSAQALASVGVTPGASLTYDGITFSWPNVASGQPDNVIASGETIEVSGSGTNLGFLESSTYGSPSGTGTIIYSDGSTQSFTLSGTDWYKTAPAGTNPVIIAPYRNLPGNTQDHTVVNVYEQSVPLQAGKTVAAVTLPDVSSAAADGTATVHVFAIGIGGLSRGPGGEDSPGIRGDRGHRLEVEADEGQCRGNLNARLGQAMPFPPRPSQ